MPPSKWDDEEEGGASPPPPVNLPRRGKFDDEEEEEVLDSWDAEDDSDAEREKEAKAKAEAEANAKSEAAKKKSKAERIEEHRLNRQVQALEKEAEEDSDEDEAERRARLRATEKESDLAHAADLFGEHGGLDEGPKPKVEKKAGGPAVLDIGDVDMQRMKNRSVTPKSVVVNDPKNPTNAVDLSAMSLFKPTTKDQFSQITQTLTPLLTPHTRKPHYSLWAQEFTRQLVKDLPSGEIKKIASVLTTASNEKMREERAADKGSKKSKAAKTKVSLAGNTSNVDTTVYDDDGLDDGDFM